MTSLQPAPAGVETGCPSSAEGTGTLERSGVAMDRVYLSLCSLATLVGLVTIAYLVARTLGEARPAIARVGAWDFLTGTEWVSATGQFGALPAIYGTVVVALIAMVVAVPLAVGVAIATTVILPRPLRAPTAAVIDLLAAVPSVVYGLWALVVLLPAATPVLEWISTHNLGIGALGGPILGGRSLLLAGLVLALMILPIITAVVREVFATVPDEQREAALALGATRWEMIHGTMLPWARSGIVGASALGLGRAVGETIAVAMILGNQPAILESLLGPGQTLAGTIALEYSSAVDATHTSALVAMAVVLFIVAFVVNLIARLLVTRAVGRRGRRRRLRSGFSWATSQLASLPSRVRPVTTKLISPRETQPRGDIVHTIATSRRWRGAFAEGTIWMSLAIAIVPLFLVIGYAVSKGASALSVDFFTSDGEPDIAGNGIKHALVGTLIMMGIAAAVAIPFGLLTALFIRECGTQGPALRRVADGMGVVIDVLLGVPSIVAGLVIALTLVLAMGSYSALAGGLALAIIMFPIVVRSTDEILRLVPCAQVEAAVALGSPRWRTTWSVVLPNAAPGIITGIMIALARVSGETAPLIVTALGAQFYSTDITHEMTALPLYIFNGTLASTVPIAQEHAWGAALVLVTLVLVLNITARLVARWAQTGARS